MDESPEERIRRELAKGEQLLWAGCPTLGLVLRSADPLLIPFSILWVGFAIFWEIGVLNTGAPVFMALFGIPFILMGLYVRVGHFLVDARQRAQTHYAVTSEMIIISTGRLGRSVKSLALDTLLEIAMSERSNGGGSITFGALPPTYWWHSVASWPGYNRAQLPSFELTEGVRAVYEIIRDAQRAAKQRRS